MQCKKDGLVIIRHNNLADEWGDLCAAATTLSAVAHEPLINYGGLRTLTGAAAVETEDKEKERRKEEEMEDRKG